MRGYCGVSSFKCPSFAFSPMLCTQLALPIGSLQLKVVCLMNPIEWLIKTLSLLLGNVFIIDMSSNITNFGKPFPAVLAREQATIPPGFNS